MKTATSMKVVLVAVFSVTVMALSVAPPRLTTLTGLCALALVLAVIDV
jgi:hypothetical protein